MPAAMRKRPAHWPELVAGKTLDMQFVVPSRQRVMKFHVAHQRTEHWDGVGAEVFQLKLSGVLGYVVPSIDVYYSAAEHVLLRFVGVSDLSNASHDNYQADITFHLADRKPADVQLFDGARKARLAPCP
jgi:hypothetical protein